MRIAITADPDVPVPPIHYGGIERIIDLLVSGLVDRGHEVTLVAHATSTAPGVLRPYPSHRSSPQADMLRIRSARAKLIDLATATAGETAQSDAIVDSLPRLVVLDRYERSAMRRRHRALRELRKFFAMWRK